MDVELQEEVCVFKLLIKECKRRGRNTNEVVIEKCLRISERNIGSNSFDEEDLITLKKTAQDVLKKTVRDVKYNSKYNILETIKEEA